MINTYSQSHATLFALLNQCLQLATVGAVVARVNSHLINILGRYCRNLRNKVYVGNNGGIVSIGAQSWHNLSKSLSFGLTLSCKSHNRRASVGNTLYLRH